jgi:hypothetical protein
VRQLETAELIRGEQWHRLQRIPIAGIQLLFSISRVSSAAAGVTAKYSSPMISGLKINLPAQNPEILKANIKA